MSLHQRRYSAWLLAQEERLTRKRELVNRSAIAGGIAIALLEALTPWDTSLALLGGPYTPDIPPLIHIGAAALFLPVLYFMLQTDYRRKLQSFANAMGDLGRRLFFLDPYLELEEFEVQERYQGALLLPTQRALTAALRTGKSPKLSDRVNYFYHCLPSPTYEQDRMGLLSVAHPRTAISWGIALALIWLLWPGHGLTLGSSTGLTFLTLLLPLYLITSRLNSRFAYELALYNWLRLG